jgi:hypothetical protein
MEFFAEGGGTQRNEAIADDVFPLIGALGLKNYHGCLLARVAVKLTLRELTVNESQAPTTHVGHSCAKCRSADGPAQFADAIREQAS